MSIRLSDGLVFRSVGDWSRYDSHHPFALSISRITPLHFFCTKELIHAFCTQERVFILAGALIQRSRDSLITPIVFGSPLEKGSLALFFWLPSEKGVMRESNLHPKQEHFLLKTKNGIFCGGVL